MRLLAVKPLFIFFLTGKYFAIGDNIRNKSECVPPGIELEICGSIVDWKPPKHAFIADCRLKPEVSWCLHLEGQLKSHLIPSPTKEQPHR